MAMHATEIERLIKTGLPDAEVTIKDLKGDGNHYEAHVASRLFLGKTRGSAAQVGLRRAWRSHGRCAACARTENGNPPNTW